MVPAGLSEITARSNPLSKAVSHNNPYYRVTKWSEATIASERERLVALGFDFQKSAIAASIFGPQAIHKINDYPEEYYSVANHFIKDHFSPIKAWNAVVQAKGDLELVRQELIPTVGSAISYNKYGH